MLSVMRVSVGSIFLLFAGCELVLLVLVLGVGPSSAPSSSPSSCCAVLVASEIATYKHMQEQREL
jgi:hypothetical protein